jgi:hypothetical protein
MSFSWSYSRLKSFETCPKRFYEVSIQKNFKDESEQLAYGDKVHKALEFACKGKEPLPAGMEAYQPWVDYIRSRPGKLYTEQKYALTRDFRACEYFAPGVWFRGIADVVVVMGAVALVMDFKTGRKDNIPDGVQLFLVAQCIFCHYPDVQRIVNRFIWLQEDSEGLTNFSEETFDRADMAAKWTNILPRVKTLEDATKSLTFPPKPNRLCARYCPVTSCPFHGTRQ